MTTNWRLIEMTTKRVLIARYDWIDAGAVLYEGVKFSSAPIVHGVKLIAAFPAADPQQGAMVTFDTTDDDPPSHQEWRALNE